MKVLYVAHCRCMYGANKSLLNLMLDLRERYHVHPYVLLPAEIDGEFAEILDNQQIPYFVCPFRRWVEGTDASLKELRALKKIVMNFNVYRKIYKELSEIGLDMIHTNSSTVQIGAWLSRRLGIPHVWHIREFGEEDYNIQIIYPKWIINSIFTKASIVISISESIAMKYRTQICPDANIQVIYNGILCENKERTDNEKSNLIMFVCVGALSEQKGQLVILNACRILRERGFSDFKVCFIGSGTSEYEDILRNKVIENGIDDLVCFLGYRDDVNKLLTHYDVGIIASEKEAFGRVTVEYMYATMPVIGTASGGTVEIIEENVNGLLFTPNDEMSLADCMQAYLENPKKIMVMGHNAYQKAIRNFSLQGNTDKIYKIYRENIKDDKIDN